MTSSISGVSIATEWLEVLRRGTMQFDLYYRLLHEEMAKHKQTLSDLGSSKEEMDELLTKSCKLNAEYHLSYLRTRDPVFCDVFVRWIREDLKRGRLTPDQIGTSDGELDLFLIPGF